MFTAVTHYFAGVVHMHLAKQASDESAEFLKATDEFRRAAEQIVRVQECEKRMLAIAQPIACSAYYVRRHQVAGHGTEEFRLGLELMVEDLSEGFYPAKGFTVLNPLLARLMACWDLNARVEGVVTRLERALSSPKN
jgi:hypothetical protein